MPFRWTGGIPARQYAAVSFFLALLTLWFGGTPAWAATVERIKIGADRVVVHFDARVAGATALMLAGPQRIAIDAEEHWKICK